MNLTSKFHFLALKQLPIWVQVDSISACDAVSRNQRRTGNPEEQAWEGTYQ